MLIVLVVTGFRCVRQDDKAGTKHAPGYLKVIVYKKTGTPNINPAAKLLHVSHLYCKSNSPKSSSLDEDSLSYFWLNTSRQPVLCSMCFSAFPHVLGMVWIRVCA